MKSHCVGSNPQALCVLQRSTSEDHGKVLTLNEWSQKTHLASCRTSWQPLENAGFRVRGECLCSGALASHEIENLDFP